MNEANQGQKTLVSVIPGTVTQSRLAVLTEDSTVFIFSIFFSVEQMVKKKSKPNTF